MSGAVITRAIELPERWAAAIYPRRKARNRARKTPRGYCEAAAKEQDAYIAERCARVTADAIASARRRVPVATVAFQNNPTATRPCPPEHAQWARTSRGLI